MAQGTVPGCLVLSENRVYTFRVYPTLYDDGSSMGLPSNYCSWSPTSGSPCSICVGGLNGGGNCPSSQSLKAGVQGILP